MKQRMSAATSSMKEIFAQFWPPRSSRKFSLMSGCQRKEWEDIAALQLPSPKVFVRLFWLPANCIFEVGTWLCSRAQSCHVVVRLLLSCCEGCSPHFRLLQTLEKTPSSKWKSANRSQASDLEDFGPLCVRQYALLNFIPKPARGLARRLKPNWNCAQSASSAVVQSNFFIGASRDLSIG